MQSCTNRLSTAITLAVFHLLRWEYIELITIHESWHTPAVKEHVKQTIRAIDLRNRADTADREARERTQCANAIADLDWWVFYDALPCKTAGSHSARYAAAASHEPPARQFTNPGGGGSISPMRMRCPQASGPRAAQASPAPLSSPRSLYQAEPGDTFLVADNTTERILAEVVGIDAHRGEHSLQHHITAEVRAVLVQ